MSETRLIKIAFWNLQNLFGTYKNYIATDFEFTPENGWTDNVKNTKLDNLSKVIRSMDFGIDGIEDKEPDLLGLSEVEDKDILQELINRIGRDKYLIADYKDSPDLRGIDVCLVYSKDIFELIETKAYSIDFRYPTRDILLTHLKVKSNDADLYILVNHWPSRRGKFESCQPNDTAHARNTVAESCGKIVDAILKIPKKELIQMPEEFLVHENSTCLEKLENEWNKNVLVMGDFNDDPYDESVLRYLGGVPDIRFCRGWKEILELRVREERNIKGISFKKYYLEESAALFNCMWKLIAEPNIIENQASNSGGKEQAQDPNVPGGTIHYWRDNRWSIFDQFVISRGLYYGKQKLQIMLDSVRIAYNGLRLVDNLTPDRFDDSTDKTYYTDKKRIHPSLKSTPMEFVFLKYYYNEETADFKADNRSIPQGRDANTGYSDHFPIQCMIKLL